MEILVRKNGDFGKGESVKMRKKIIPIVENAKHADLPGIEFFRAERAVKKTGGCNVFRLVRYKFNGQQSDLGLRLDIGLMGKFLDRPSEITITGKVEVAIIEMAKKIASEIIEAEKSIQEKNTAEKLYMFLKREVPGFGQYLSLDRQGEVVLEIIEICGK
ncbi:MAG: hypothetical protein V1867_08200 [Candidatus Falkowbacteria bacterium]